MVQDGTIPRNLALSDLDADGKSVVINGANIAGGSISITNAGTNTSLTANNTVDAQGGDITLNSSVGATGSVLVASGANVTTNSSDGLPDTGVINITGNVTVTGNVHATTSGVTSHTVNLTASSATITVTPTGLTGSGLLTLNPGAANDVIVQPGGQITVTQGGGHSGDLVITSANNVTMESTPTHQSSIVVDGSVNINNITNNVILQNVTTADHGGTGGVTINNVGGQVQLNGTVNAGGNDVTITNIVGNISGGALGSIINANNLTLGTAGNTVTNVGSSTSDLNVNANSISINSSSVAGATNGVYLNNTPSSDVIAFNATTNGAPLSYRQSR